MNKINTNLYTYLFIIFHPTTVSTAVEDHKYNNRTAAVSTAVEYHAVQHSL